MAQFIIYSHADHVTEARERISAALHTVATKVLRLPEDKRFHRFIPLAPENFVHPADRSARYTIIEVHLFSGRTPDTKRAFIRGVFAELERTAGLSPQDVEITLLESPREHWGIRGKLGDELVLNYEVAT
jgi:phenylpyruvate tautomerase PptA (4-oxalocrotonate tautomerase family)